MALRQIFEITVATMLFEFIKKGNKNLKHIFKEHNK